MEREARVTLPEVIEGEPKEQRKPLRGKRLEEFIKGASTKEDYVFAAKGVGVDFVRRHRDLFVPFADLARSVYIGDPKKNLDKLIDDLSTLGIAYVTKETVVKSGKYKGVTRRIGWVFKGQFKEAREAIRDTEMLRTGADSGGATQLFGPETDVPEDWIGYDIISTVIATESFLEIERKHNLGCPVPIFGVTHGDHTLRVISAADYPKYSDFLKERHEKINRKERWKVPKPRISSEI